MTPEEVALLAETTRINYRLRSTFFYRKLKEYNTLSLPVMVAELFSVEHLYSWDERKQWGIGEDAFGYINENPDFHLFQVFCHPKLLREQPRLVAYYRNIAALSQKSVGYLAEVAGINGDKIRKIEADLDSKFPLSKDQAYALARLFNEHVTLIIDASIQSLTKDELHAIMLTSTGAQIDGSWRNAIGEEAERVVQRLLVNEARERNLLAAFIPRVGTAVEKYDPRRLEEQFGNIHKYRGVLLTNRTSILFSSEPDISLLDTTGGTTGVLEVKGGADPAGALERYGAAKKSFGESRRLNPGIPTILVASCITPEVHARIKNDPIISSYYNLTELLKEDTAANVRFMQEVFSLLGVI